MGVELLKSLPLFNFKARCQKAEQLWEDKHQTFSLVPAAMFVHCLRIYLRRNFVTPRLETQLTNVAFISRRLASDCVLILSRIWKQRGTPVLSKKKKKSPSQTQRLAAVRVRKCFFWA